MAKRKVKEEFEIKFWKDWLEADILERQELVGKLPFIGQVQNLHKLPVKLRKQVLTTFLNGFFEDLEGAIYTKMRLEKQRR